MPRYAVSPNSETSAWNWAMPDRSVELPALERQAVPSADNGLRWPQRVRRAAREVLHDWGLAHATDDLEVIVSELATNAVLHTTAAVVTVRLHCHEFTVRVEVEALAARRPMPKEPGDDEESGRGLLIVEALATRWGASPDGGVVWCEIELSSETTELNICQESDSRSTEPFSRLSAPPQSARMVDHPRPMLGGLDGAGCLAAGTFGYRTDGAPRPSPIGLPLGQERGLITEVAPSLCRPPSSDRPMQPGHSPCAVRWPREVRGGSDHQRSMSSLVRLDNSPAPESRWDCPTLLGNDLRPGLHLSALHWNCRALGDRFEGGARAHMERLLNARVKHQYSSSRMSAGRSSPVPSLSVLNLHAHCDPQSGHDGTVDLMTSPSVIKGVTPPHTVEHTLPSSSRRHPLSDRLPGAGSTMPCGGRADAGSLKASPGRLVAGSYLRSLRTLRGLSREQAAKAIEGTAVALSQLEHGGNGLTAEVVHQLLQEYRLAEGCLEHSLVQMLPRKDAPWLEEICTDMTPGAGDRATALLRGASGVRVYSSGRIPRAFQLRKYAEGCVNPTAWVPPAGPIRVPRLEARDGTVSWTLLLDESVLQRAPRSPIVMASQFVHLLHLSEDAWVNLRVVPLSAPAIPLPYLVEYVLPREIRLFREHFTYSTGTQGGLRLRLMEQVATAAHSVEVSRDLIKRAWRRLQHL
ncbi:Scr1 family TA system antitoxin-like transcriptional regulator [Streptomyces sp. NPDC056549]|uniref:Scr1 family TA system antitoxin-like transcriptional regulator n=1 Tax=Streptomyces sp. NPDC056549 TaxID=3345864 RepID=UPI0036AFAA4F